MMVSSCLCGPENSPRYSAPMRTGIQGITLDILLCHDDERSWMPNATRQARLKAGAQRTLEAVACTRLILIEAPSSAYHGGMLSLDNSHSHEEETSCASTPTNIHFTA